MKTDVHLPLTQLVTRTEYQLAPPLTPQEYDNLQHSIGKVGILSPLLVEEENGMFLILDGHHRYQIAHQLHITTAPCCVVDSFETKHEALISNVLRRQMSEAQREEVLRRAQELLNVEQQSRLLPELLAVMTANRMIIPPSEIFRLSKLSKADQKSHHQQLLKGLPTSAPQPLSQAQEKLTVQTRKIRELTTQLNRAVIKDKELVTHIQSLEEHLDELVEERYRAEVEERHAQVVELSRRIQEIERGKEVLATQLEAAQNEIAAAVAEKKAAIINVKRTLEQYEELFKKLTNPETVIFTAKTIDTLASILMEHFTQNPELSDTHIATIHDAIASTFTKLQHVDKHLPDRNDANVIPLTPHRRKQALAPSSVKIIC